MFDRCLAPLFGAALSTLLCALFLLAADHAFHQPSGGIGLPLLSLLSVLMAVAAGAVAAVSVLCLCVEVAGANRRRRFVARMDAYNAQRWAGGGMEG